MYAISILLLVASVWVFRPALVVAQVAPDDKETAAKAAIVAHAANMTSFPFQKCRFSDTRAQAKSVKDALDGRLFNVRSSENRYVADGNKEVLEGFAPLPDPKDAVSQDGGKTGKLMVTGNSDKYLGDGEKALSYAPSMKTINLFAIEKGFLGAKGAAPPLTLLRDPHVLHEKAERFRFTAIGFEEILDRPVVTVRFDDKHVAKGPEGSLAVAFSYSFDPARGHLPIRYVMLWNDKVITQSFVTHVRECSKGRWFPARIVAIDSRPRDTLVDVRETKLLDLDVDQRPSPTEFTISVAAGTGVKDYADMTGNFFRLKQDQKISLGDLPNLFRMLDERKVNPVMDTAILPASPLWSRWWKMVLAVGLVAGGACYLWRLRARAAAA